MLKPGKWNEYVPDPYNDPSIEVLMRSVKKEIQSLPNLSCFTPADIPTLMLILDPMKSDHSASIAEIKAIEEKVKKQKIPMEEPVRE
jgi:hypothetical protein